MKQRQIKSAQQGDVKAYEELVKSYQGMAIGYAYSILGDFQMAEDAAQEAFLEAFEKIGKLREAKAFPGWLRAIVFKQCDRLTRGGKLQTNPLEEGLRVADGKPDPLERVEKMELSAAIHKAIMSLPEGERAVTSMFYIEDKSHKEIAEFLSIPVSTVKSRLHSARSKLKEEMMIMVETEIGKHQPEDTFAGRTMEAIDTYTEKGPAENQVGSPYQHRILSQIADLLKAGDEGFRVAVELSRHRSARVRDKAALHFGLCGKQKGRQHLLRLMKDPSAMVRNKAMTAYVALVSPSGSSEDDAAEQADTSPEGIEKIIPMLRDVSDKIRRNCVKALSPYAQSGNAAVRGALEEASKDPKHKVRHFAALGLGQTCPDCTKMPT